MNFGQSIASVFKQYFVFSGRACRSEFWWFFLFQFIIALILAFIIPVLYWIYALGTLIPYLAVLVRRLHDTDRTGWWVLIVFVPIIGFIAWLVFTISPGDRGENRFGPDPLRPSMAVGIDGTDGTPNDHGETRYCTNCGSELASAAQFCRSCGTAV